MVAETFQLQLIYHCNKCSYSFTPLYVSVVSYGGRDRSVAVDISLQQVR
jgi:hypothetical protein